MLEKHSLNILPEMTADERTELRENLQNKGFDGTFPIFTYQGKILDGWNRYLLCLELDIEPVFAAKDEEFTEGDLAAVEFIVQVNTRRNLTSSQKAAFAVECGALFEQIKRETEESRRAKQKRKNIPGNIEPPADSDISSTEETAKPGEINGADSSAGKTGEENKAAEKTNDEPENDEPENDDEHHSKTAAKIAATFGTNRTYVNEAARLKEENPDEFEKVKSGEKSLPQVRKDIAAKKRTYFEEIAARFAEFAKVLKKLQEFGETELVVNLQSLYKPVLDLDIEEFERLNAEIATFELCEECRGAGCQSCAERGFFKPETENEPDAD